MIGHTEDVSSVALSHDGATVASAGGPSEVRAETERETERDRERERERERQRETERERQRERERERERERREGKKLMEGERREVCVLLTYNFSIAGYGWTLGR